MKTPVNILHLSDLHFFSPVTEDDKNKYGNLKTIKNGLIGKIADLHKQKPIDIIIITGDITSNGTLDEYRNFEKEFLQLLLTKCKSKKKIYLLVCPGNHDLNQSKIEIKNYTKEKLKDKEQLLLDINKNSSLFDDYSSFFKDYSQRCKNISLPTYASDQGFPFCCGKIEIPEYKIKFFIMNSAWFALGKEKWGKINTQNGESLDYNLDRGKLILGRQYVNNIMEDSVKGTDGNINIGLLHHPFDYLADSEMVITGLSHLDPSFVKFASKQHLILCAHTHMPFATAHLLFNEIQEFRAGASSLKNNAIISKNPIVLRVSFYELFQSERIIQETTLHYCPSSSDGKFEWIRDENKRYSLFDNKKHLYKVKINNTIDKEYSNYLEKFPDKNFIGSTTSNFDWIKFFKAVKGKDYDRIEFDADSAIITLSSQIENRIIFNVNPKEFDLNHVDKIAIPANGNRLIINLVEFEYEVFTEEDFKKKPGACKIVFLKRELYFSKLNSEFINRFDTNQYSFIYTLIRRPETNN